MCDGFSEAGMAAAAAEAGAAGTATAVGATAAGAGATAAGAASAGIAAGAAGDAAATAALASATAGSTLTGQILGGLKIVSELAGLTSAGVAHADQVASNKAQTHNAYVARSENSNQVGLEAIQQHDLATQKITSNDIAAREASATALAGAGYGGLSVSSMLGDIAGKSARYDSSVQANFDQSKVALSNQMQNINNNAASTINSEKTPAQPDYLGSSLRIGDDVSSYLRNYGRPAS